MKKLFILILLLVANACYKVQIDDTVLTPNFFQDEYHICDTVVCNMTCSVFADSAKMQFIKKVFIVKSTNTVRFGDEEYLVNKDSVTVLQENYEYSAIGFKCMLIEKSKIQRTGDGFYFSPNVGLTWYTFDKIFNTYIK